jgi:hypothetical protein
MRFRVTPMIVARNEPSLGAGEEAVGRSRRGHRKCLLRCHRCAAHRISDDAEARPERAAGLIELALPGYHRCLKVIFAR